MKKFLMFVAGTGILGLLLVIAACSPQAVATPDPTPTAPVNEPAMDLALQLREAAMRFLGGNVPVLAPVSTAPFRASFEARKDGTQCKYSFESDGAGRFEELKKVNGTCAAVLGVQPPADVEIRASVLITVTGTISGTVTAVPVELPTTDAPPPPDLLSISIDYGEFRFVVLAYQGERVLTFRKISPAGNVYAKDLYINDPIERFSGIWLFGENYDTLRVSYNHDENGAATFREWKLEDLFPLPK